MKSARELSFDRFVTPSFFVQGSDPLHTLTITAVSFKLLRGSTVVFDIDLTGKTLQDLIDELYARPTDRLKLSYAASFIGSEPASSLVNISGLKIDNPVPLYRKYFFSDDYILRELVQDYFIFVLRYKCCSLPEYERAVAAFKCPQDRHMSLWLAFYLLEKRRLFEYAAGQLSQTTFTSGDGEIGMLSTGSSNASINISIGDVFSLSDNPAGGSSLEDGFWRPGAENIFGDKDSFWYRNQVYVREMFERLFGDYSLRPNQVMFGEIDLQKDLNYYAYFDSYPYTFSPLSRSIFSGDSSFSG